MPAKPQPMSSASRRAGLFSALVDAWRHATGHRGPAVAPSAQHGPRLPIPLIAKTMPAAVRELTSLLDRLYARETHRQLHMVEQSLVMQRGSFDTIPDPLLKSAHLQLQALVRRSPPTPGLARLLDLFERRLIDADIRQFVNQAKQQR